MKSTILLSIIIVCAYLVVVGFELVPSDLVFPLFLVVVGFGGVIFSLGKESGFKDLYLSQKAVSIFWSLVFIETGFSLILLNLAFPPLAVLGIYIGIVVTTYYGIKQIYSKKS
ncbi:MAG: hypothetical protein DRJ35_00405 [Thermoprotei archaeon]|nr:MAG: hypothetical protein DRJ35_00405 [Thermoprotei archaeon]